MPGIDPEELQQRIEAENESESEGRDSASEGEVFYQILLGDDYYREYDLETAQGTLTFRLHPLNRRQRWKYLQETPDPVRKHLGLKYYGEDLSDVDARIPKGKEVIKLGKVITDSLRHPHLSDEDLAELPTILPDEVYLGLIKDIFEFSHDTENAKVFATRSDLAPPLFTAMQLFGLGVNHAGELTELQLVAVHNMWMERQKKLAPDY